MDFEKREEGAPCSALKLDMSFGHDGGGDFSLPDYLPEIQRLLYISPAVLPETKFLSGNVLEMSGTLTYSVLYLDGEGKLCSTSLVNEYSADTALPVTVSNASEIFVDCDIENVSCRVVGPRNLSIKTRLRSRVFSDEILDTEDTVLNSDDKEAPIDLCASVERSRREVPSVARFHGMTTGSVNGEIAFSEGQNPMAAEGSLCVTYCEATADGVLAKGEVYVKCLVSEGEGFLCKKTKIPFDITVPVSDIILPADARAWGRVASVSVTPSETGGNYSLVVEYDMEAETLTSGAVSLCCDAYSTEVESTLETRECDILGAVCFGGGQYSATAEYDVKNSDRADPVIDVSAGVGTFSVTFADGKLFVAGTLKLKVLSGKNGEVSVSEFDMPIRYELPGNCAFESTDFQSRVSCAVLQSSGKVSGGVLSVSAELFFSFEVLEKKRCRFVTEVRLGTERPEGAVGKGVKVYYPSSKESLWSVCKKYHASCDHILKVNKIEGEEVLPGKPVIIF